VSSAPRDGREERHGVAGPDGIGFPRVGLVHGHPGKPSDPCEGGVGRLERAAEARDRGGLGDFDRKGGPDLVLERREEKNVDSHGRILPVRAPSPIESAGGREER